MSNGTSVTPISICTSHGLAKSSQELPNRPVGVDFRFLPGQPDSASMHEVGIMEEAVRVAVETAKSSGANQVLRLQLRVGALSGAVPEALRFAFDVVCSDPMTRGARLEIEPVPASCWCPQCETEFKCEDLIGECPRCRNVSGELRHGRELELASVEIC